LKAAAPARGKAIQDKNVFRRPVFKGRNSSRAPIGFTALVERVHRALESWSPLDANATAEELIFVLQLVDIVDILEVGFGLDIALEDAEAVVKYENSDIESCIDQRG
jgi:hypothetical protein